MTFGVYWTFGFPDGLYEYKFFGFSPAIGGHANDCAELRCTVNVQNPQALFSHLENLAEKYPGSYVFAYQNGNTIHLGSGGYCLFDFDFAFLLEVERMLTAVNAIKTVDFDRRNIEPMKFPKTGLRDSPLSTRQLLTTGASAMKKANAQTFSLGFGCRLSNSKKVEFTEAVKEQCIISGFEVFYYFQFVGIENSNLFLQFSMGRQGVNLEPIKSPDIATLESRLLELMQKYEIQKGHEGGFDCYPHDGPFVQLMKDREFILGG